MDHPLPLRTTNLRNNPEIDRRITFIHQAAQCFGWKNSSSVRPLGGVYVDQTFPVMVSPSKLKLPPGPPLFALPKRWSRPTTLPASCAWPLIFGEKKSSSLLPVGCAYQDQTFPV